MEVEKLIECVRECKLLYDPNQKFYHDKNKKNQAWDRIASAMNVPTKQCRKTWGHLRDGFRRSIKKQYEANLDGSFVNCKRWRYENEMLFLLPYLKPSPVFNPMDGTYDEKANFSSMAEAASAENTNDNFGETDDEEYEDENNDNDSSKQHMEQDEVIMVTEMPKFVLCDTNDSLEEKVEVERVDMTKKQLKRKPHPSQMEKLQYIKREKIEEDKQKHGDIDKFFDSMAATVKTFPLKERALIKAKVFSIVSQMEIKILSNE